MRSNYDDAHNRPRDRSSAWGLFIIFVSRNSGERMSASIGRRFIQIALATLLVRARAGFRLSFQYQGETRETSAFWK